MVGSCGFRASVGGCAFRILLRDQLDRDPDSDQCTAEVTVFNQLVSLTEKPVSSHSLEEGDNDACDYLGEEHPRK